MLIQYIEKAIEKAIYTRLEDGSYSGRIPDCPGTIAFGDTTKACREELHSVLEDWIIIKLRHGDNDFPVIDGLDLNERAQWEEEPSIPARNAALSPS